MEDPREGLLSVNLELQGLLKGLLCCCTKYTDWAEKQSGGRFMESLSRCVLSFQENSSIIA